MHAIRATVALAPLIILIAALICGPAISQGTGNTVRGGANALHLSMLFNQDR